MIIIFYIKEYYNIDELFDTTFKIPYFLKKLVIKFFKIANILTIKENIVLIPYSKDNINKLSDSKIKKLSNKIHKLLYKENVHTIAISNSLSKLKNIDIMKNYFYSNNYDILNGKWLFKHLSFEVLEYLYKKTNKPINEMEISILTNSNSDFIKENIKLLSQNVKNLNIVTPNIEHFKPLTQDLYNSFGISIRISNNKKKILTHSDVIFNFDFSEEILNKFTLPLDGIIINYNNKIRIRNKLFNGLNIHNYNINIHKNLIEAFEEDNLLDSFDLEILYESLYFKELSFSKMLTHFMEDALIITSLEGSNGTILDKEYKIFVQKT